MTAKEIRELIDSNLDDAIFELSEVFEKSNSTYNDLLNQFVNRQENFSLDTFRSKLKAFVLLSRKDIRDYYRNIRIDAEFSTTEKDSSDQIYQLLCHLNFTSQVKYFKAIVKSKKPIIPFVIRAEQNYGQSWLYNRLIYHYQTEKHIHTPITIDFRRSQFNASSFIQHLALNIGVKNYHESDTLDVYVSKIKDVLLEKIETKSQILIIKNVNLLIHYEEFEIFVDMMNHFYTRIEEALSKLEKTVFHKCIFFFIEDTTTVGDPYSQYCLFPSKIEAHKARKEQGLKFFALTPIHALTNKCIKDWLDAADEDTCDCFDFEQKTIEQLLIDCGNGHPEKVLHYICRKIGHEFDKHKSKWLKY